MKMNFVIINIFILKISYFPIVLEKKYEQL
jgi:hypothetical protein